jgi:hypothetical protein
MAAVIGEVVVTDDALRAATEPAQKDLTISPRLRGIGLHPNWTPRMIE